MIIANEVTQSPEVYDQEITSSCLDKQFPTLSTSSIHGVVLTMTCDKAVIANEVKQSPNLSDEDHVVVPRQAVPAAIDPRHP